MKENEIATLVLDASFKVHKKIGPGLLESVYQSCLIHELRKLNLRFEVEKQLPIYYDEVVLPKAFRIDLLIEDKLLIELKSVEQVTPLHFAQLLTYLRLSDKKLGLLINFNSVKLTDGIRRVINGNLAQ